MIFKGTVVGVSSAVGRLASLQTKIEGSTATAMGRTVAQGASIVKGRASGRPGPRVITGDYRRRIAGDHEVAGNVATGQVGTNAVQGPRLERGFVGPDILGRVYNQPPYAHFEPSVPEIREIAHREQVSAVQGALR